MTRAIRRELGLCLAVLGGCDTSDAISPPTSAATSPGPRVDVGACPEGETCLEGNACGPARCRSGECVALSPPACSQLDDACYVGVCLPDRGECVAQARGLPGATCETAFALAARGLDRVQVSPLCGQRGPSLVGCTEGLEGGSAHFDLDLRSANGATAVTVILDADVPFEAALTRGPCGDPLLVACAEPFYVRGPSRRITAELEPELYHLVVTGRGTERAGSVRVTSAAGSPACDAAPEHDACTSPLELGADLGRQTVLVDMGCATSTAANRCTPSGTPDVFYELDLSQRSSAVLLNVEVAEGTASLFAGSDETCGATAACGQRFSLRLAPDVYRLGVAKRYPSDPEPLALGIELSEEGCGGTTNDDAATALDLDPAVETQHIDGNTACGTNDFAAACNDDRGAPDLYYRLDLRAHSAPRRLRISGSAASWLAPYILDASSMNVAACDDASIYPEIDATFILAPRVYYLVIDGYADAAGRFELDLQSESAYAVPLACVSPGDYFFEYCLVDSEPACSASPAHPECLQAAVDCGLAPEIHADFCSASPGCCDGTLPPEACLEAWRAASACP